MWSGLSDRGNWDALRTDAESGLMKGLTWDVMGGLTGSEGGREARAFDAWSSKMTKGG